MATTVVCSHKVYGLNPVMGTYMAIGHSFIFPKDCRVWLGGQFLTQVHLVGLVDFWVIEKKS